jgi:hypothetical protein
MKRRGYPGPQGPETFDRDGRPAIGVQSADKVWSWPYTNVVSPDTGAELKSDRPAGPGTHPVALRKATDGLRQGPATAGGSGKAAPLMSEIYGHPTRSLGRRT